MPAPTRTFLLSVNEGIMPITKYKKKGFNSIQLQNGTYFNTKARVAGSQLVQFEYINNFNKFANDVIISEARRLQRFWYLNVNKYFNRRAFGMYYYKSNKSLLYSTRRFRGRYSKRQQYRRREHTGQLKRALVIRNKTVFGCELYVNPCYAKSGAPIDYVNILMRGARPGPKPYVPALDKRIEMRGRYWNGISRSYWAIWQAVFQKQVRQAEERINRRIEQYIISQKIMEKRDIKRVSGSSRATKDIVKTREAQSSRPSRTVNYQTSKFTSNKYLSTLNKFKP